MLLPDQGSASSFPSPENAARPSPIGRRFPGLHGRLPMVALFGAMGILGASIILLRTSVYGVGIGADEVRYISMARNLADGNGFQNYAGEYRATLPPLFPALLAVAVLFGLDAPDAARFVNAAAFGLTVCLSGLYMAGRVKSRLLAAGVAAAILVSPNLMYVSSSALAGGPYLLLALLSLTALDRHLRGGGRSALLWAAVFASLSVVTRLAGVLLAATGVLTPALRRGEREAQLEERGHLRARDRRPDLGVDVAERARRGIRSGPEAIGGRPVGGGPDVDAGPARIAVSIALVAVVDRATAA